MYIIICLILFGLLIAIHEFGHFITAKVSNVKVNEFSIGMGPLLLNKQIGETKYSLRLLPIGGFCSMEGEDTLSEDSRAFGNAPFRKQLIILAAGSIFNFLTGLIIVLILYSGIQYYTVPLLDGFMEDFPCQGETMLMEGDEILSINGRAVLLSGDVSTLLALAEGQPVDMTVLRNGSKVELKDLPLQLREYQEDGVTVMRYGLLFTVKEATGLDSLRIGFFTAVNFVRNVFWSLEMLFTGSAGIQDMTGPVGIVQTMTEVGESSETIGLAIQNILYLTAFIAINLSVMNLLPIPALDGGRIFFLLINGISLLLFRRRIPEKFEGMLHFAGLVLLLGLMAVIMIQDISRILIP